MKKDVPIMSRILTDGFHRLKTNVFTYPFVLPDTYINQKLRFGDRVGTFLAYSTADDGAVVGCCEVDDASTWGEKNPAPRLYMCNLAVYEQFQRKGIATALVLNCEEVVRNAYDKSLLHLRTRDTTRVAINFYSGLGYRVESKSVNEEKETILLGQYVGLVEYYSFRNISGE